MGAASRPVMFSQPWEAVVLGLVLIGIASLMARGGHYRRWVQGMSPRLAEKSPHGYLAGPFTIAFFGLLSLVAGFVAVITGR